MSEPRFDSVTAELRATAPPAPEDLRERIRAMREPSARRAWRLQPALASAVAIAAVIALGAAAIGGLKGSTTAKPTANAGSASAGGANRSFARGARPEALKSYSAQKGALRFDARLAPTGAVISPGSRIQKYDVFINLRVKNLSRATQAAVRTTRGLGGYVAGADYSTSGSTGDSQLNLRVPVQRVQSAIARFTGLGTILSQRIAVNDLQAGVDRLAKRIATLRATVARLERKQRQVGLTQQEQGELAGTRSNIKRLAASRETLVRSGAYAEISLVLTSRKAAAKQVAPGRFDRFWGDAGEILGKEAIVLLYALVVAGPFLLLAAIALLGERARRRRANSRLLEETA